MYTKRDLRTSTLKTQFGVHPRLFTAPFLNIFFYSLPECNERPHSLVRKKQLIMNKYLGEKIYIYAIPIDCQHAEYFFF